MNDFTKEDLENIYWHFEYYLECLEPKFGNCQNKIRFDLMQKIKCMIDNYCDHESLDDYELFLPKVGAILTDDKKQQLNKLDAIRKLYLKTVWPEKFG